MPYLRAKRSVDEWTRAGGHAVADADSQVDVGVEFVAAVDATDHRVRRESTDDDEKNRAEHGRNAKLPPRRLEFHPTRGH